MSDSMGGQDVQDTVAGGDGAVAPAAPTPGDTFQRDPPEVDPARAALVKRMQGNIKRDKAHWDDRAFKRMKESAILVREGADPMWKAQGLYIANIVQRHVSQKVASLYAKNPKVRADRRQTMDFKIWDGSAATLQAAAMDPMNNAALMQDVQQGTARRKMMDGVAQTMQIVANQQLADQVPPFKQSMKTMVARGIWAGVGYVKMGYTRQMEPSPEVITQTSNLEARLAFIEGLMADSKDGEFEDMSADAEQMKLAIAEMQAAPLQITDEGIRFDFPESDVIIPDRNLKSLRGFQGCDYVTEEMMLSRRQIEEMFGVDIGGAGVTDPDSEQTHDLDPFERGDADNDQRRVRVWCVYHRRDGLVYWLVDGYKDFLTDPAPPPITLKRFWPWFAFTLNLSADKKNPYPPSDVELITHQQNEYNRARQGLRDHRIAARPKWVTSRGKLTDEDMNKLTKMDAHEVVELDGMAAGEKVTDLLQMVKHDGIDQEMYDVGPVFQDIQRTVGVSQADLGAPAGVTATEASIGENAHLANDESAGDDLDELLSEIMQEAGAVLLMEMDVATVTKIAGPGAQWPTLDPHDLLNGIFVDIEAGGSGRPNKAAEMKNFTTLAPLLLQMPGVNPEWMVRQAVTRMDDRLDPSDAVLDGVPSMLAMARIHEQQAMGVPYPGAHQPGDPATPPGMPSGPGAPGAPPGAPPGPPGMPPPPGGPPGAPPGMPPPGMPPHPPMPAPAATPPPAPPGAGVPGQQGGFGGDNAPKPPGQIMQPPARPAPGPGTAPMGRG